MRCNPSVHYLCACEEHKYTRKSSIECILAPYSFILMLLMLSVPATLLACCLSMKKKATSRVMTVWIILQFAIYSAQVVYKARGYGCLLSFITSFCLPPHGPHTVPRECDERQWVIDARGASTHLLCSSGGGVLRDAQPLRWGVESCSWDAMGKLRNFQTPAFTRITSSLTPFFFPQPHQTVLRRGLFTRKASRWAPLGFWLP